MAEVELVEILEDAGVSGGSPLSERPAGSRIDALLRSRAPEVDAVVVVRLDRLGRDAAETLRYLKTFANGKVGLVSITERIDLSTPQGRAMAQMSAVFGELERNLIAQRTAEALAQLRASGRVFGSVPYGFLRVEDQLVADEREQAVLAEIRRLRELGTSYAGIAQCLNGSGIPAKRGGRWSSMSIRSVFRTAPRIGTTQAIVTVAR